MESVGEATGGGDGGQAAPSSAEVQAALAADEVLRQVDRDLDNHLEMPFDEMLRIGLGESTPVTPFSGATSDAGSVIPSPSLAPSSRRFQPSVAASSSTEEVPVGGYNFDNLLRQATVFVDTSEIVLPWEQDEWKQIFDPNYDPMSSWSKSFNKRKLPLVFEESTPDTFDSWELLQGPSNTSARRVAVTKQSDMTWTDKREADLQRAIKKWVSIVANWPSEWRCSSEINGCDTLDASCELISDYLSGKSPATLVKRANSMLFLMSAASQLGFFFPLCEPDFYQLLKTLKSTCSQSRLKSIVEAVTFCRFSFQISDVRELVESKRCAGVAARELGAKVLQAEPLRVNDVCTLRDILEHGHIWDRAFAGACLFCIYSRARWSDFCHGDAIRLDYAADGSVAYADSCNSAC